MILLNLEVAIVYLTIVAMFVQQYRATRNQKLLQLGLPAILVPLLGWPIVYGFGLSLDLLGRGTEFGFFPYTLVERGEATLGDLASLFGIVQNVFWCGVMLSVVAVRGRRP